MDPALDLTTVAPASVLEPHGKALVRHAGTDVAVFRQGDTLDALAHSCPHSGSSPCGGRVEDGHARCPANSLRFRLSDGLLAGSAPGSNALCVRPFAVRVVDGALQVAGLR